MRYPTITHERDCTSGHRGDVYCEHRSYGYCVECNAEAGACPNEAAHTRSEHTIAEWIVMDRLWPTVATRAAGRQQNGG